MLDEASLMTNRVSLLGEESKTFRTLHTYAHSLTAVSWLPYTARWLRLYHTCMYLYTYSMEIQLMSGFWVRKDEASLMTNLAHVFWVSKYYFILKYLLLILFYWIWFSCPRAGVWGVVHPPRDGVHEQRQPGGLSAEQGQDERYEAAADLLRLVRRLYWLFSVLFSFEHYFQCEKKLSKSLLPA